MSECASCGAEFGQSGRGRPRKYCSEPCKRAGGRIALSEDVASLDEVLRLLTVKAREGSVTAMATLMRHLAARKSTDDEEKPADPFDALDPPDDLASRRENRSQTA